MNRSKSIHSAFAADWLTNDPAASDTSCSSGLSAISSGGDCQVLREVKESKKPSSTAMRLKIMKKDRFGNIIRGIYSSADNLTLSDNPLESAGQSTDLLVLSYPYSTAHQIARNSIGMCATFAPCMGSSAQYIVRNANFFEGLLMLSTRSLRLQNQSSTRFHTFKAHHFIAVEPCTPLGVENLTNEEIKGTQSTSSVPIGFFEHKVVSNALKKQHSVSQKSMRLHPKHIAALLNIIKHYAPSTFSRSAIAQKRLPVPDNIARTIRYLTFCLFVNLPSEYSPVRRIFPCFESIDKFLSLEEFIGWYLPLCWKQSAGTIVAGDGYNQDAIHSGSMDTIERKIKTHVKKHLNFHQAMINRKKLYFMYHQPPKIPFLESLHRASVQFESTSGIKSYLHRPQVHRHIKGYLRISKFRNKEVIGYVFEDGLVQSFAAWRRELTERCCQRCGERHLTIDCPWIFTCTAAVHKHAVHNYLMKVAASHCSAIVAKKLLELSSRSKEAFDVQRIPSDNPRDRKKRARNKTNAKKNVENGSKNNKVSLDATYKCNKCQAFSSNSYAALFNHITHECTAT